MEGLHADEDSVGGNHSKASSRGRRRLERELRKEQQHMQEGYHTKHDSNEGSSKGNETCLISPSNLVAVIENES